jgi:phosphotransferase system HPr (HPr) family protein
VPTSSETLAELPEAVDLHARPAADFVRTAMQFDAQIVVAANDREADAKSLMEVLGLGAKGGTTLRLTASGTDADLALNGLAACIGSLQDLQPAG